MWTDGFSKEVKRSGREADHSPPSTAEVRNGGAMPPLPYTHVHAVLKLFTTRKNLPLLFILLLTLLLELG
jgi:hypothetical protein